VDGFAGDLDYGVFFEKVLVAYEGVFYYPACGRVVGLEAEDFLVRGYEEGAVFLEGFEVELGSSCACALVGCGC
jgi:hypothetical protein